MITRRIPGRRFTKEDAELKEAAEDKLLPKEKWSLVLAGRLEDWDFRFQALKKLEEGVNANPDLFDGEIPRTYVDLAKKFIRLAGLIGDAFTKEVE